MEANEAASYVQELAGDSANIIFGAMYDETVQDEASITVIATGLDQYGANAPIASVMSGFNNKAKMSQPKPQAQSQPKKTAIEDRPSYTAMESGVPTWKSNVETRSIDVPTFLQRKR